MKLMPRNYFLDDVFEDFNSNNSMKCDVYEKDGAYNIEVDVPGFKKEDINIDVDNDYLTIRASKHFDETEKGKNYICRERRYGKFERSFYIGDLKTDDVEASFENGTLKIRVPKIEESKDKKRIEIK